MKKVYPITIILSFLIITNCAIPDGGGGSGGGTGTVTTNTVSFNESIAYILESTTANPIPGLEIVIDNPAVVDITYNLAYSDVNISGSSTITIIQGASSASIYLMGGSASTSLSTLTASYNSIDVASTQIRVYSDTENREIVELSPSPQDISVFGSGTITVFLNLPALAGGVLVSLSSMGNVTVPASVILNADTISGDFNITAGGTVVDEIVTASLGSTSLNAIVHVID